MKNTVLLFSFLIAISCFGQGHYIQFNSGLNFPSTDFPTTIPGYSTSVLWGYNFDSALNIETGFGFNYFNFAETEITSKTIVYSSEFLLGYNFDFIENSSFRFQAGGSVFNYRPSSLTSKTTISYSAVLKAGIFFPVSEHLVFSQTAENHITFTDNLENLKSGSEKDNFLIFSAGFNYFFDEQKNFVPKSEFVKTDLYESPQKKDSDSDGIADYKDDCPDIPGTKENHGCPQEDSDQDGITNTVDNCPEEAETFNGFQDDDGCPDSIAETVALVEQKIENSIKSEAPIPIINQPPVIIPKPEIRNEDSKPEKAIKNTIEFIDLSFPKGSSTFKREQVESLSQFVKKAKSANSIELKVFCWENQPATDNQKLAQKRAENIRKFLVQMGVKDKTLTIIPIGKKSLNSNNDSMQSYEVKLE